ncbi:MAG: sigma-70 family RNA polymerase sigma factor [Nibricoccus sp.]
MPRPQADVSDSDAVKSVISGDCAMFEIIVRRYNLRLYRVGMAYLRNHMQTEDAMQNTYLKAFVKLRNFDGTAAFSTWLTRIMINECLMLLRGQKKFLSEKIEPDELALEQDSSTSPTRDSSDKEEIKHLLEQGINTLSQTHRAVYILRDVQQLSTADTASSLGISESNVKVSLHRAREELKTHLLQSASGLELFEYAAPYCNAMTARVMGQIRSIGRPDL